jgi:hypothetical protein
MRFRAAVPLLFTLLVSASSLRAADATCQQLAASINKYATVPTRIVSTASSQARGGKEESSETVLVNNAIFIKIGGKWIRSKVTSQEMADPTEDKDAPATAKSTCRYERDEAVNGEMAAVYSEHTDDEGSTVNAQFWISKSKGLPLRSEIDMDVGGSMGKSHRSSRYEYSNVQPPTM